jgi:hypothetical protein
VLLPPDEMAAQQAIMEECRGGNSEWFSVGAMFVAFREALEACVIVSVSAATTPMMPLLLAGDSQPRHIIVKRGSWTRWDALRVRGVPRCNG